MDDHILTIFAEETAEHIAGLEQQFLDLEVADDADVRRTVIDQLFRHAHTVKGNAKSLALSELQVAAQTLEDHLDRLRANPDLVAGEFIDGGLKRLDAVRHCFDQWQQTRVPTDAGPSEGSEPADTASLNRDPPAEVASNRQPEDSFTVRVSSEVLDRMHSLSGELRVSQRSATRLADQLTTLAEHLRAMPTTVKATTDTSPFEVQRSRIENVLDQIQRLQTEHRRKHTHEELLLQALEADIRRARLLPLATVADSMRRTVRDLAQTLGKSIRFEIDVGDVLLDKAVIEALRDPLLHLIRNAADHGIESPEERQAAGKSADAVIRIGAARRGDRVTITIGDDGRGVDFNRIRQRLRDSQKLSEAELSQLSESDLARFLFQPGFTTRTTTDEISGRGVGLDVVLDTVKRLQGTVVLEPGVAMGTSFSITVPVTISTVRILTVLCDGQVYGIPSSAVIRTGSTRLDELHELEGHLVLTADGEPVRWVNLRDLLGTASRQQAACEPRRTYLLVSSNGRRIAVGVDDLDEEIEVLLKPLGFPLTGLPGIVGATIRPDGSVQLVLDLSTAIHRETRSPPRPNREHVAPAARVLVVDDSPTTRALLRSVLTAAGYSVTTASDGIDALERLGTQSVGLVVSDIEMPRMDGFELTRQIKSRLDLPVILVTGLEKDEHRRRGMEAGADAYVVKSTFEGEGLLEIAKQFCDSKRQ